MISAISCDVAVLEMGDVSEARPAPVTLTGAGRSTFDMIAGAQSVLTQAGGGAGRLRVLVWLGEGDLEGPLVGTAHGL